MKFYTSCILRGNEILYRGFENSKRIVRRVKYKPTLFIPTQKESKFKTLSDQVVDKVEFDSIKEAKNFVSKYEDVDNFEIFGNTNFNYVYLCDEFRSDIEFDYDKIVFAIIDIEVLSDEGFPEPDEAKYPIVAITLKIKYQNKDISYVFALKDYAPHQENIKFFKCADEQTLLETFLKKWAEFYPDVVTGWNSEKFDLTYIINRLNRFYPVIGSNNLSPWNVVYLREVRGYRGRTQQIPEILGITVLDYLDLYKKFTYSNQESYRLDYICHVELNERKLSYDEYANLSDLYQKNHQRYIEYNVKDVDLVDQLEDKLNLLKQAIQLAFDTKSNFADVFMQTRMCDNLIYDYFLKHKLVVPFKKEKHKDDYSGAFVKAPIVGRHDWVVSMDVASMYPNIIVQQNISPDTIVEKHNQVKIDSLLQREHDLNYLKEENLAMSASGWHFRRNEQGFLPKIIEKMYEDRKKYKKMQIRKEQELELIKAEMNKRGIE
jgi:DNA polymerase elongation subunit (family B)